MNDRFLLYVCRRERKCIILRPPCFSFIDVHFLIRYCLNPEAESAPTESHGLAGVQYTCYRVPAHLHGKHWKDLLSAHRSELIHRLVLHDSLISQVLTKLEDPQFIHAYTQSAATDPSHGMRFELPRFNLGFELRQRQLVSLEYSGYKLSKRQQLVTRVVDQLCSTDGNVRSALYTLPDFHQYLLLQRIPCKDVLVGDRRADSIALVLVGRVVSAKGSLQHAESSVRISRDSSSSAKLQVRVGTFAEDASQVRAFASWMMYSDASFGNEM